MAKRKEKNNDLHNTKGRTPRKIEGELRISGRVCSSCSTDSKELSKFLPTSAVVISVNISVRENRRGNHE